MHCEYCKKQSNIDVEMVIDHCGELSNGKDRIERRCPNCRWCTVTYEEPAQLNPHEIRFVRKLMKAFK